MKSKIYEINYIIKQAISFTILNQNIEKPPFLKIMELNIPVFSY